MKGLIYYFTILSALTAGNAFAECTLNPDYNFPLTATIPVGDIIIYSPGSFIGVYGATLTRASFASLFGVAQNTILATCPDDGRASIRLSNTESTALSNSYFASSLSDLGVRTTTSDWWSIGGNQTGWNVSGTNYNLTLGQLFKTTTSTIKFVTYITAATNSGAVDGDLAFTINTTDGQEIARVYYSSFNFTAGTCRVNTYDTVVDFGNISRQTLVSPGATSDEVSFNINVSCGKEGLIPSLSFTGETDSQNVNVFTNTSGEGYSEGVGVQIMRGNEVITPGQELSLGESSTAGIDYEFGSRVFRLSDKLTEGSLNVPVVFTLAYQ